MIMINTKTRLQDTSDFSTCGYYSTSQKSIWFVSRLFPKNNIANARPDCIESKHIVLDPEYQREVVWDETRASNLITSILSKLKEYNFRKQC